MKTLLPPTKQQNNGEITKVFLLDHCIIDERGCWNWTRTRTKQGYGTTGPNNAYVHRIAYTLWHGPIPDGKCVLHRCDNPSCFNPDHLWAGTRHENSLDSSAKGRMNQGVNHPNAKLNDETVKAIRAIEPGRDNSMAKIGNRFGVTHGTVWKIRTGRSWKHVA